MRENEALIEQIADRLRRKGWRLPALMLLDVTRPFSLLVSQFLWVAQPTLALFVSRDSVRRAADLLEDTAGVDALIARLEQETP